MEPLVSVFIPVYNGEQFISRAIKGILGQTYKNFELIIVNDGSTDNTVSKINKFDDKRIILFHNDENKGLTYTRNRGFDLAMGDYFAINDADDFSYPDRLQIQLNYLIKNKSIGACGAFANRITNKGDYIWKYPITNEYIKERMFWGGALINSTVMFNMSYLRKYQLYYDPTFYKSAEDYDLFERSIRCFDITNIPKVLVDYYEHGNNVTFTENEAMEHNSLLVKIRQVESLVGIISEEEKVVFDKYMNYRFNFILNEINILERLLTRIVEANQEAEEYTSAIFENKIAERFFQCVYHSDIFVKKIDSPLLEKFEISHIEVIKSFIKSLF